MPDFKDFFSHQASIYSQYRPTYPENLFIYLSSLTPEHNLAWDCGTGNGQTAHSLTKYYKKIYASDPSEKQISNAIQHSAIEYHVEKAERSLLHDGSVDLITCSQSLHWFDFENYYREVKRVLKPSGIIAAWIYKIPYITPEVDKLFLYFHNEIIGEFWQEENRMVERGYADLPFPFEQITPPPFKIEKKYSFDTLLGFMNSWSALQRFINIKGYNPLVDFAPELLSAWGDRNTLRVVSWDLVVKIGKNHLPVQR
jgi:ubiquinone/menaquinone biosynthesis C-methylase UbiE